MSDRKGLRIALALMRLIKLPALAVTILMTFGPHARVHYALVAALLWVLAVLAAKIHDALEYVELGITAWEHRHDWADSVTGSYVLRVGATLVAALITAILIAVVAPDG